MGDPIRLDDIGDVVDALLDDHLVPALRSNPDARPVLTLRNSMARFSWGDDHVIRRTDIEAAIAGIAGHPFAERARSATRANLAALANSAAAEIDAIEDIGRVVPVLVVLEALGVDADARSAAADDVATIVAVIGRGAQATDEADAATDRLLAAHADATAGPVAAVSLLYQSLDATAALLGVALAADTFASRASALVKTARSALVDITLGDHDIGAGSTVELNLDHRSLEFGAGPHACPGRTIAEQLVDGMLAGIADAGFVAARDRITHNADGKPVAVPLVRDGPAADQGY